MIHDAIDVTFTVVDWFWPAVLCGLIVYLVVIATGLKIDKSDPPRVLPDQEIEDLESRR